MSPPAASSIDPTGVARRPRIVDGGLATELEARGNRLHPWLWSGGVFLEHPEAVEALHLAYLEAGAEILIGASYQMSFEGLARAGLARPQAAAAMRRTVEVARSASMHVARPTWVAASVGPYGATLCDGSEYRGNYGLTVDQLVDFHRARFEVLAGAGADWLAVETIPSFEEAEALLRLLHENGSVQAWFSFSCRDGSRIGDGSRMVDVARLLETSEQVLAVGVNCTAPRFVSPLMDAIRQGTGKRIVVYPNSGEGWAATERRWTGSSERQAFRALAREWADRGAWAIGGCCRVGPEWIREIAAMFAGEIG